MAQLRDGELPEPTQDPSEVRESAREVLQRAEFQPPRRSLVDRALERAGESIAEILARGAGAGDGFIGWLLLAVLIGVAVWVVRRVQPSTRASATVSEVDVDVYEQRSSREWTAAALEHEEAGNWVQALRCRYQALVAELVEREVVRDVPGRTVGEYREELLHVRPGATAAFADAAMLYEDAWFGSGRPGPGECRRFVDGAQTVLAEVKR